MSLGLGSSSPKAPLAPSFIDTPTISGSATVGQTLVAVRSKRAGEPTAARSHQWQRDDGGWANIVGATDAEYECTAEDAGLQLRVVVTITNASGTDTENSAATDEVTEDPANTVAPTITGTAEVGETLTAGDGTFTGYPAPTLTRQWQIEVDEAWEDINGETGTTYEVAAEDDGLRIRLSVTATNTAGSVTAYSAPTAAVTAGGGAEVPVNESLPTLDITTPVLGDTITVSEGSWTNAPESYTYQWYRNGMAILGATGNTWPVGAEDFGAVLSCGVIASNAEGDSEEAISAETSEVGSIPVNTSLPVISGSNAFPGTVLNTTDGSWDYDPSSYTYQWYSNGLPLPAQTTSSYQMVTEDIGSTITCGVTAVNATGPSNEAISNGITVQEPA